MTATPDVPPSRFARLLDLAKEPSSERRRVLLHEVTDLFFEHDGALTDEQSELFGAVMAQMSADLETEVLRELSCRMSAAAQAPRELMRDLARQPIAVAAPVLARSRALADEDLIEVIYAEGPEHQMAVSRRAKVSEAVSDALVAKGDDQVLESLLKNKGARLSGEALQSAADRAQTNARLHAPLVSRRDAPPEVLNQLFFTVSERLRATILRRNESLDPAELEAAMARARARVGQARRVLPADYEQAESIVSSLATYGELTPQKLIGLLRGGERTAFTLGFAQLCEIDFATAQRLIERQDLDGLATVCRAAEFDRPAFVTIAVLIGGGGSAMGEAERLGRMYLSVPVGAAKRAMRFWKVRATPDGRAAA